VRGHVKNVPFQDFVDLVVGFGFREIRVRGSHHAFGRHEVPQLVNLQPRLGEVKPYQIRAFLRLVESYNLRLEEGD
jgi:predicted RNA binding protein YcfA (HicA-like mRNA interferase family)